MAENQTLRQADNLVVLEGILLEKRLEEKIIKTKDGDKNAIIGELDIEVKENEVHTVHVFSYEKKADNSDNGIFKGLKTINEEYKSVASHGREDADKVRITQGQIGLNEYFGQDGLLKSFPQLSTNFVNRINAGEEFNPKAEFEVEAFVKSISPEIKGEDETGRIVIETIIPVYGGKVIPFKFIADAEGADYIDSNYEIGNTVRLFGDIINYKEKKVEIQKAAFGKDKEKITYKTLREYVITGGSEPYEEENVNVYDVELIKKAMVERQTYLDELKAKKDQPKKEEKKGFGSKPGANKPSSNTGKKQIDLPF